jgi:hypothetical protein
MNRKRTLPAVIAASSAVLAALLVTAPQAGAVAHLDHGSGGDSTAAGLDSARDRTERGTVTSTTVTSTTVPAPAPVVSDDDGDDRNEDVFDDDIDDDGIVNSSSTELDIDGDGILNALDDHPRGA